MPFYKKKPVTVEARQLSVHNMDSISLWIAGQGYSVKYFTKPPTKQVSGIIIETLEGNMEASFGDFIIKGVSSEFYPCKPDIFKATYMEAVTHQELIDILSWDEDPEEDGPLPYRIDTHEGFWEFDEGDGLYYFSWEVQE